MKLRIDPYYVMMFIIITFFAYAVISVAVRTQN